MKAIKNTRRKAEGGGRKTSAQRLTSSASARRGVLLLVILGMLTLFLLIGTAFISSSNQYRRANKSYSKVGEQKNLEASQKGFLGEVINQLIRDTSNQNSALRYHSLLRDMYGTDGFITTIGTAGGRGGPVLPTWAGGATNPTGGQMIEFQIAPSNTNLFRLSGITLPAAELSKIENYYNGQTLTFLDGVAKGRSTRIMGYYRTGPDATSPAIFRLLSFPLADGSVITDPGTLSLSRILINGRPFNGTGVGYNSQAAATDPKLNAVERISLAGTPFDVPIALAPNAAFFDPLPMSAVFPQMAGSVPYYYGATTTPVSANRFYDGLGGSDESYDAPDFQNMYLAWTSPNPGEKAIHDFANVMTDPTVLNDPGPDDVFGNADDRGGLVLPSFHRPDLIHYWAKHGTFLPSPGKVWEQSTLGEGAPMLRKVLLRPNWLDHPDFTGSNPEFEAATNARQRLARMIYGPWDVDNDKDGVRDSIWVDFGAPVMVGSKGRLVKPLAAIMVLDMDGRLNLNAHGTRELAGANGSPPPVNFAESAPGTPVMSDQTPDGQAFGVAEISLRDVIGQRYFERLMSGVDAGDTVLPGAATGRIFTREYPGKYGYRGVSVEPGGDNDYDLSAQLKMQGFPELDPLRRSNFGTLPDLRARYSLGLNNFGQAITDFPASDHFRLVEDSPYEFDISSTGPRGTGTSIDIPFSLAELERILRVYDVDAGTLPSRLYELAGQFRKDTPQDHETDLQRLNNWRTLLTTDSYDLPEPGVQLPAWVRTDALGAGRDFFSIMRRQPVNASFADLIEYRIRAANNWPIPTTGMDPNIDAIRRAMAMLVAPEMMAGLKLDLNRPLGNGRDDDGNGVVDEPGELEFNDTNDNGVLDPGEEAHWFIDEARAGITASQPTTQFENAVYRDDNDRDGSGMIDAAEQALNNPTDLVGRVNLHNYRRQLLARHLYVLAMAVVDPLPDAANDDQVKGRAQSLAQWAINSVDFRDPDNIMTAFEYDENPFLRGWFIDPTVANPIPIDGDLSTANDIYGPDKKYDTTAVTDDTGGLVWGLERPEVLMTETLAWHDRATEDRGTGFEDAVTDENLDGKMDDEDGGEVGSLASNGYDTDSDQRVRPQGATFVEFYNPYAASPGASADTHLIQGVNGINFPGSIPPGTDLGVDLSAVDKLTRQSPVWRLNVKKTVDFVLVAGNPNESLNVGGPDHDPDDPDLRVRPQIPDRCVYFTNFDPQTANANWDDSDGAAFFCSTLTIDPSDMRTHAVVRPGRYLVAGSGTAVRDNGAAVNPLTNSGEIDRYEAWIGDLKTTVPNGASLPNQPRRAIVLDPDPNALASVMLRDDADPNAVNTKDPNVAAVQDQAGFRVFADPDTASVAIIDTSSRGYQRFNVSEPANGYPDHVFNSVWTGKYYSDPTGTYKPIMDIPLDNQRSGKKQFGADDMVDGQSVIGATDVRWFRGTLGSLIEMRKDNELRLTLSEEEETAVRTIPAFSWLYLQRLANPLLPWNPEKVLPNGMVDPKHNTAFPVNPYRTVDSSAVNVTGFTGQARNEKRRQNGVIEDYNNAYALETFTSLQRGRTNETQPEFLSARIAETQGLIKTGNIAAPDTGFRHRPIGSAVGAGFVRDPHVNKAAGGEPVVMVPHNLWSEERVGQLKTQQNQPLPAGYNRPFGLWVNRAGLTGKGFKDTPGGSHFMNSVPDCTLGFMNEPFRASGGSKNSPGQPFPWLTWNNRPFANPGELIEVPAFRSSLLLKTFSFAKTAGATPPPDTKGEYSENYAQHVRQGKYPQYLNFPQHFPKMILDGPFGHVLNFFRTIYHPGADPNISTDDEYEAIPGLYRVLDFVAVPSLYVGSETWLNPQSFGDTTSQVTSTTDPRYGKQPPFNKVASRREPGRVNINTIARKEPGTPLRGGKAVWDSLWQGNTKRDGSGDAQAHAAADDDDFFLTRRGYWSDTTGPGVSPKIDENTLLNKDYPTLFANPFRSAGTASLVPIPNMIRTDLDTTLNRSFDGTAAGSAKSDGQPFGTTAVRADTDGNPSTIEQPGNKYRDSLRNPYFRYSPISRLSSMTTTRSNVFAIWVTIGFFEVEEVLPWADVDPTIQQEVFGNSIDVYNRVYPDGYRFGKEAGIETGEVERVREFAIVDRTIPVAFEPGANHNSQETVRLRRKIE